MRPKQSIVRTSDRPDILLRTCGGSLERIKAMTYAVVEGIVSREAVLDFFATLFTGNEADSDSDFWDLMACNVHELR